MSNLPECKRCGNYVCHGPVICKDCLSSVLDEVDIHLLATTGHGWTYAKDIVSVIREALCCGIKKMPPALLPEEREYESYTEMMDKQDAIIRNANDKINTLLGELANYRNVAEQCQKAIDKARGKS